MKYTITINQLAASKLGDIDLIDCTLLEWLYYFCVSPSKRIERTKDGVWVSYEHLAEDLPILNMQRTAIGNRLRALRDKGYIKLTTNKGHRKSYVQLADRSDLLFTEPNHTNGSEDTLPNHDDGSAKPYKWSNHNTKIITRKLSTNVDNGAKRRDQYGRSIDINEVFSYWNQATGIPIQARIKDNRNACSNLLKKYGADELRKIIDIVAYAQTQRYAPSISDFSALQSKTNELQAWVKRERTASGVAFIGDADDISEEEAKRILGVK